MRRVLLVDLRSGGLARLSDPRLGVALQGRPEMPTVVISALDADEFPDSLMWYPRIKRQDVVPSTTKMAPPSRRMPAGTWRASLGLALRCRSRETGYIEMRRAA